MPFGKNPAKSGQTSIQTDRQTNLAVFDVGALDH